MARSPVSPHSTGRSRRTGPNGQGSPSLIQYPNGFELLFVPNHSAPVLALDLWVRVGSASEAPRESGMAHLVEHMLFKGTERRPAGSFAREIEGVGGEVNAFTTFDHTVYTVVVASRFANLGLDLLADAVFHSSFEPAELEREKQVVLAEIKRGRDLPQHHLSRLLFEEMFAVHPYGRPVIGEEGTVSGFSRKDCLAFVRRWYRSGNMTLVVVGDAECEPLAARVGKAFAGGGRPAAPPRAKRSREPARQGFRGRAVAREVSEIYFDLALPGPAAAHPEVPALDVLVAVLGQGEASRLQHRIKLERNLVRAVGAGSYTPRDPGLIYVGGVADPGLFAEAFESICTEMFRLCRDPVGSRELERAKENIEADFVYQKETVQGQAQKAGFFHSVLGSYQAEEQYLEGVRKVQPDTLRSVARKYLRGSKAALVLLHPADRAPPLSIAEAGARLAATEGAGRRKGRKGSRRNGYVRRVLENGTRVLIRVNRGVPVVTMRAAFLGGVLREPERLAGAFHLLAAAQTRGTRSRDVYEIARGTDAIAGQIDGFSGRNSFGLKGEFLAKHLEEGFELFADLLCHPVFPGEELEKVREDTLASIRLRRDNPGGYAFRLFEETLYGSHPYARDVLGRPETVRAARGEDLRQLYAASRRPDQLAIGVAGEVDPDWVLDFLGDALAALAAEGAMAPRPPRPELPAGSRERVVALPIEQAHIVVGFPGAQIQEEDRYPLRLANAIMSGQGGRLFRKLRDEMGLAYAVTSACVEGLDPGYVAGYVATAPASAEQAGDALLREFGRLAAGEVTEEQVDQARRKLVGGFEIAAQENAFQAAQMALDEIYDLGYRTFEQYATRVFATRREEVIDVARRYLAADRHVRLVLGPPAPHSGAGGRPG